MIKNKIADAAKALGIEKIGFAKGSVVALFPYFVKGEEGNLSMYSRSRDYHIVAGEKLEKLSNVLRSMGATYTEVHVDKGKYNDRQAAYNAGLGFFGRNGMLICEEYGSYFFIGQIIHDLQLEADSLLKRHCMECGKCEEFCPGQALSEGKLDESKCLSAITQRRGELNSDEEDLIKKQGLCWGCDVCQMVCPHNSKLETTAIEEFLRDRKTFLTAKELEGITNKEFKRLYGDYAFSWRGRNVLLRNLRIVDNKSGDDHE